MPPNVLLPVSERKSNIIEHHPITGLDPVLDFRPPPSLLQRLLLNPPAFIAMSSLDRQNLTFTGKRKDDAESTDQAPKRAKNMGRPPILTESQKCKLVRLYLFTNLDVDGIGKLLGFRHKTPR